MPKIPTDIGGRRTPRPQRGVVSVRAGVEADAMARAGQAAGSGLEALGRGTRGAADNLYRMEQERDEFQAAQVRSKFLQDQIALESEFDKDQDWRTQKQRYGERLGKLRSAAAQSIANPRVRAQFEMDSQVALARGEAAISAKAWQREVDEGRAGLDGMLMGNMDAALAARDPGVRDDLVKSTLSAVDRAFGAGYIGAQEATKYKAEFGQNFARRSIELLPPDQRIKMLLPPQAVTTAPEVAEAPLLPMATDRAISSAGGADADTLKRIAWLESRGEADAVNPQSGASGPFQFMPATAAQYGVADPADPAQAAKGAARLLEDNRRALRGILSREPTPAELYLAHQQGAAGAGALLANPKSNALVILTAVYGSAAKAKAALEQNGGNIDQTAGEFANMWLDRFNGGPTVTAESLTTPGGGWDFSQKTGTAVDLLPPDVRQSLLDSAISDAQKGRDDARKAAQLDVALSFGDAKQSAYLTGQVEPGKREAILAAYPNETGAGMVADLDTAAQEGRDVKLVQTSTLAEDATMLRDLAAVASIPGPGSEQAARRYDQVAKAIKTKHDAISADPAAYARESSPAVDDAWTAATAEPGNAHLLRSAVMLTEAEQGRLGVDPTARRAMPETVAQSVVAGVMGEKTPKNQLDTLLQFVDMGDPEISRRVLADLSEVKGGLPAGTALIADIAIEGGNRPLAEKLWTELNADTKGAELGSAGNKAIDETLSAGIVGIFAGQAAVTGDTGAAANQAQQLRSAAAQIAKARGMLTGDFEAAAREAVTDLTSQFAMLSDDSFAQVYYPIRLEDENPGALERGLLTLRKEAANAFPQDPYSQATARDVASMAVWVNDRDGVSLIVPGSNRYLMHVSYDDAVKRGIQVTIGEAIDQERKAWPLTIPKPEGPVEPMVAPNDPDITQRIKQKFKATAAHDLVVVDSRAKGMTDGRKVEFYPPDERDNPNPGKLTVEVFDPSLRGEDLDNIVAADFLHYLGKNDPVLIDLRQQFAMSLTSEQKQIDRDAYRRAQSGEFGDPEERSFDEWFETHRLDQYLGAMLLPEGSSDRREWMSIMTPKQRGILDRIEHYLKTGKP